MKPKHPIPEEEQDNVMSILWQLLRSLESQVKEDGVIDKHLISQSYNLLNRLGFTDERPPFENRKRTSVDHLRRLNRENAKVLGTFEAMASMAGLTMEDRLDTLATRMMNMNPKGVHAGWRFFQCDDCLYKWSWPTRDYRSPSSETCPQCQEGDVAPYDSWADPKIPVDESGNIKISHTMLFSEWLEIRDKDDE